MLYTRLTEDNKLEHYCKNCTWSGTQFYDESDTSICVYSKNYSNKFIALKTLTNKYTLHDPTLPRISNIPCPNSRCLTNLEDIDEDLTLHLTNAEVLNIDHGHLIEFLQEQYEIPEDSYEIEKINNEEL